MKLTLREKQALSRIEIGYQNKFSLKKINRILEPRYSNSEITNAFKKYYDNLARK